jgi:hypothetical protein
LIVKPFGNGIDEIISCFLEKYDKIIINAKLVKIQMVIVFDITRETTLNVN